jgi:ribonuclease P protein component
VIVNAWCDDEPPPTETFCKQERLRHKNDFIRVYGRGQKQVSSSFVIYMDCDADRPYRRLGISVRKRVGNAVERNRCKRLVRELFRNNKAKFPPGADLVVVVKRAMVGKRYAELAAELDRLLQ